MLNGYDPYEEYKVFEVYWCGAYVDTVNMTIPAGWTPRPDSNMQWSLRSWVLEATSASCELSINSVTPGNHGPVIAEVRAVDLGSSASTPSPPLVPDTEFCPTSCASLLRTTAQRKPANGAVQIGQTLTYSVTLENLAAKPLVALNYFMALPGGVELLRVGARPDLQAAAASDFGVQWNSFSMSPGELRKFSVSVRIPKDNDYNPAVDLVFKSGASNSYDDLQNMICDDDQILCADTEEVPQVPGLYSGFSPVSP